MFNDYINKKYYKEDELLKLSCKIFDFKRLNNNKKLIKSLSLEKNYLICFKSSLKYNIKLSEKLLDLDINFEDKKKKELDLYFKNIKSFHLIFKKIILNSNIDFIKYSLDNFKYPERSYEYFILEKNYENLNLCDKSFII